MENLGMNYDFWRGKRVFLTGHTGFKGSWLSLWLQSKGCIVTGYALAPVASKNLFELAQVSSGMRSIIGDIRDAKLLARSMQMEQPEIVIHMAAQPLVRASYEDPLHTFSTNVMGTANLLDAVRSCSGVRAVVNVTTDKCYENREWLWPYREDEAMGGHDPYSASKACSELVTSAYRRSFFATEDYARHGVGIASARAGNVIGGGDWAKDRLLPDVLHAFSQGCAAQVRNPMAVRPWQHVLEPLSAYMRLAQALCEEGVTFAQAWNFGPEQNDAQPVQYLVDCLIHMWGDNARCVYPEKSGPHEANTLRLDTTKARRLLGWSPRTNLTQALEFTVNWAKAQLAGGDAQKLCLDQIKAFEHIQ
jgi:CDP-glucose 4,6-dehydratase